MPLTNPRRPGEAQEARRAGIAVNVYYGRRANGTLIRFILFGDGGMGSEVGWEYQTISWCDISRALKIWYLAEIDMEPEDYLNKVFNTNL